MHVLLDIHVANNDQQNACACSTASTHEDLHEMTSISSCADLNSESVFPNSVSQGMDLCLEFRSTTTVHSHQQISRTNSGKWVAESSIHQFLNLDRSITTFGSILASITKFFTNFPSITPFWTFFFWTASQVVTLIEGKVSRQGEQGHVRDAERRSAGLTLTLNIPPCPKKQGKSQRQGQCHRCWSKHASR